MGSQVRLLRALVERMRDRDIFLQPIRVNEGDHLDR